MRRIYRLQLLGILALGLLALVYLLLLNSNARNAGSDHGVRERKGEEVGSDVDTTSWSQLAPGEEGPQGSPRRFRCLIEGSRPLQCLRQGDEVYIPFNKFLRGQFDLSGRLNKDSFEYYTSYSKIRLPDTTSYGPFGAFGHFASYNVEIRERVRCINAATSVPMSVQWDATPYFYPIQVAQFALQHYSRHVSVIKEVSEEQFRLTNGAAVVKEGGINGETETVTIRIGHEDGSATVDLDGQMELTALLFAWQPESQESWFEAKLEWAKLHQTPQRLTLKYRRTDTNGYGECMWPDPSMEFDVYDDAKRGKSREMSFSFIYSLGSTLNTSRRIDFVLDLLVDASKAMTLVAQSPRKDNGHPAGMKNDHIRLLQLTFHGPAEVSLPLRLQASASQEIFMRAANWLVESQNSQGGWSIPVERVIADGRLLLKAGWHSAMAQGHALSVLVRAYNTTGDERFVDSARRALRLFSVDAAEGGVLNRLFGNDWYEEYPTRPGTFVLNGFLFSLIGLWDASALPTLRNESLLLFNNGMESLCQLLPLYDTGDGSSYDLRHVGLQTAPNLARWDYHSIHIFLLKWLHNITGEKPLDDVANRWLGYAHGRKAKHN